LWRSLGHWRVGWRWWAAATLVFPLALLGVAWLYRQWPGAAPLPFQPVTLGSVVFIGVMLVVAVLGEEVGWRGFALPRLQQHHTALAASLLLGTLWTAWHLPFWIVLDELARFGWTYWLMSWAYIVGGSVYLTWLMNNTGNSLLLAVLFHWTLNLVSGAYLPLTTVVPAYALFIVVVWIVAAGLLAWFGPARLVRRRT
jgi:membrane protease YdiL (CAAX protease family)